MASDQAAVPPSAQVVGNAFVQQFYHILHQSPQLVYRFYQEGSRLGRADPSGAMQSITTMQAINDKILSMEYGEYRAEIKTVDAQESWSGGVIVLVTGYLTGRDEVKKEFTQSFFLAPQDKGYYVLNDIFRYVEGPVVQQESLEFGNGDAGHEVLPEEQQEQEDSLPSQEQIAPEEVQSSKVEEEHVNEEEVVNEEKEHDTLENEEGPPIVEEEATVEEAINEDQNSSPTVVPEPTPAPTVQEEAPKKSYASIVKVMKENPAPLSVPTTARPAPISQERLLAPAPASASGPSPVEIPPANFDAPDSSNAQEAEADGYSVYIKSLPVHATPLQLEEIFKEFGPIKPDGIQVRSHKMQGFCFGFVEFEEASSVQSAIAASPIYIGGRPAYVEEKRATGTRVITKENFAPRRGGGGFRGDGMRGRGNYGGGRGYGRGGFSNRGDFGSRGGGRGGSSNRGGDVGYQRVDHAGSSGGGRGSRSGSLTGNSSPKSGTQPKVPAPA